MLEAKNISVRFSGVVALDNVDFAVSDGEILGLIGPNGSGKTTLLNVLSGFVKPATGRINLDARDVTGASPAALSRLGVGRTFQGVRLFRGLTVLENVVLGFLGLGRRIATARARALLGELNLLSRADDQAGALPYGEQRTVALARTLATEPRYLLLDEPAAGLNDAESDELLHALTRIHADKSFSIVIIEHDMRLLMTLCQRIHVLDAGKTLAIGAPESIRKDPLVIAAYLGAPLETA